MKPEAILNFYSVNQELVSCSSQEIFNKIGKNSIYEVIKLIDRVPLFFEEHMDRFRQSAAQLDIDISVTDKEIAGAVSQLVKANRQDHINVKLVFTITDSGPLLLTYFIKSVYPGEDVYSKGVHTILYSGERDTPNIKTVKGSFRGQVETVRKQHNAYEALLVNSDGFITEGSRSNIFFVKNNNIYTPPPHAVLMGITRAHVMKICREMDAVIHERCIHQNEITTMDGVFITGTTVDVLPVSSINEIEIPSTSNKIIHKMIQAFRQEIKTYLKK